MIVASDTSNLLDRHPLVGQQRDEAVPQLTWRPLGGIEGSRSGDAAKPAADVGSIEQGASLGGENKALKHEQHVQSPQRARAVDVRSRPRAWWRLARAGTAANWCPCAAPGP